MTWLVPESLWWHTSEHSEPIDPSPLPRPYRRKPTLTLVEDLDEEDEDLLDALEDIPSADDDEQQREESIICWSAQLQSTEGWLALTEGRCFHDRATLMEFLQWFALNARDILVGEREPSPASLEKSERHFGPASWSRPDDGDVGYWHRTESQVELVDHFGNALLWSCRLRRSDVGDYLAWTRDVNWAEVYIDPEGDHESVLG